MMRNISFHHTLAVLPLALLCTLTGCSDELPLSGVAGADGVADDPMIIKVGGIEQTSHVVSLDGDATRAVPQTEGVAVDAETIPWLLGPLFHGLDITYYAKGQEAETKRVAILQLLKKDGATGETMDDVKYSYVSGDGKTKIAEYSFKYKTKDDLNGKDARWYDNGEHYFQGVYVPQNLRFNAGNGQTAANVNDPIEGTAPGLITDQSKDGEEGNYTLLERYLGMPVNRPIHATVGRIKLPFRHRLARVLAYVLIDPDMGENVKIKGYKSNSVKEDPTTSSIRFCKVKVLTGVKESTGTLTASLTPQWGEARKAIPHFVGERGSYTGTEEAEDENNFIMFYETDTKKYIFPSDESAWSNAKAIWQAKYNAAPASCDTELKKREYANANSGYERTDYGLVPCYDLIVRPTYSSSDMVMYDEDFTGGKTAYTYSSQANSIDFEITLNNGLQYAKTFQFDLDANYQTVVYLRISREKIDYNSSGAELWDEDYNQDGYYGVNNRNGNTLSFAGSSWQRAYRIGSTDPNITDGHYYGKKDDTDGSLAEHDELSQNYQQYVTQAEWLEMFAQAYEGGLHHGDYFILDNAITIDARALPQDFVFTGHLDARDRVITISGTGQSWTEYLETTDYSHSPLYYVPEHDTVVFTLPQLYTRVHHDAVPYDEVELVEIEGKKYVKSTLNHVEARPAVYYQSAEEYNIAKGLTGEYALTEEQFLALSDVDKIKDPAVVEHYEVIPGESIEVTDGVYKVEAYDEYPGASPKLAEVMDAPKGTYFTRSGTEGNYSYTAYKPEHPFFLANQRQSGAALFAGLNGYYNAEKGEANVHEENGLLVPYIDDGTKTGWRAEIINTCFTGGALFPADVIGDDGRYDVSKVSGYIYNCWRKEGDSKTAIMSHTPALPKYQ